MQKVKIVFAISLLCGCLTLSACFLFYRCEESPSSAGFSFEILDKVSGLNVLLENNTKYYYDSIKVYNEDWTGISTSIGNNGGVYFPYYYGGQKDYGVPDQLISKKYFLYLYFQDVDTIAIDFKMRFGECNEPLVTYFKVAYNDSIYFDAEVLHEPMIQFLK